MSDSICIIDDELIICKLLEDVFKAKGYSVVYKNAGEEGFALVRDNAFDLVMLDLKMPDSDGIEILRRIKEIKPDAVVIVMTGYPSFETVQESLRLGAYDYVSKPFDINEIQFVAKRALEYRSLHTANTRLLEELGEHNQKLESLVRARTKELSVLYQVGREISLSLNLDKTLHNIIDRVCQAMDTEICSILLLDKMRQELTIKAARGLPDEVIRSAVVKVGESVSGLVVHSKAALFVEDIAQDARFSGLAHEQYYTKSFISAPLIIKEEVIGVINVNNKRSRQSFSRDDFSLLKGIADQAAVALENASLYTSLKETYFATVTALISALDAKDHYTKAHSDNVGKYAVAIGRRLMFSTPQLDELHMACQLHDLGKIGIHDHILTKPGKLDAQEWDEMKQHSLKSAQILRPLLFLGNAVSFIEQHHERFDGTGYPYGLKGDAITLGARIIAVADSFDAMTSKRPYGKVFSKNEAVAELVRNKGAQFDPKVVDAFEQVLEDTPDIFLTGE